MLASTQNSMKKGTLCLDLEMQVTDATEWKFDFAYINPVFLTKQFTIFLQKQKIRW